ncbi:MAG TPA: hypothetical protein VK427_18285, partial [Kofleriaceae bacterium]|nr:hypothetical protein [Kofleriaceae bacterium]
LAVAVMLIVLGIAAIVRAVRVDGDGPVRTHRHGDIEHAHADAASHVHVGGRLVMWRPLVIGLVHGLAGSGALTAVVFADLASNALRVSYLVLFGLGSVAGMAVATGVAGASVRSFAHRPASRRRLSLVTGALSIVIGVLWGVPMAQLLVG